MKMFLGMITLMTLLISPVYSQYEGSEDFEAIGNQYGEEDVDMAYLPEFQEEVPETPIFDYGTEFAPEEVVTTEPEVAYE